MAVDQAHPFLHSQQTEVLLLPVAFSVGGAEGFAVVGDFHADAVAGLAYGNLDAAGPGMLGNVVQAFLCNAK